MRLPTIEQIKEIRQSRWITQEEMAYKLKIDYKTYNRKENWKIEFTYSEYFKIMYILWISLHIIPKKA